jgi:integrase
MKRLPGFRFDPKRGLAHFEVCIPGTRGRKRRRATVEAVTRPAALAAWKRFCDDVDDELKGATPATERTLSWYFETHWPTMLKAIPSKKGRRFNEVAMRARILPRLGHLLLERINDAEVGDFVGALREDGYIRDGVRRPYSPETINGTLNVLRKFLRDAVSREVIAAYPIKRKLPRERVRRLELELTPEEKTHFLAVFDDEQAFRKALPEGHRFGVVVRLRDGTMRGGPEESVAARYHFARFRGLKPLFVVALETGLARGDLRGLRWSSVSLRDGWIRTERGKTGVEAVIAISAACRQALEELMKRPVQSKELVFVNDEGKPIPDETLSRAFTTAKRLAGITRRCRFHDLRHTFGSTLASESVSLQIIAKGLGHKSVRMSERYARPSEGALRGMAAALDHANSENANSKRELREASTGGVALQSPSNPHADTELSGGRCGDRTRDLLRVKQTLYR